MIIKLWKSLMYALHGIRYGFVTRKNITLFLFFAVVVAGLLIWLGTSTIRFAIIMTAWILIIIMEITNSAMEKIIDTLHPEYSKGIGHAKDMMSGAVFLAIVMAFCVTLLMVWEPLSAKIAAMVK
jgi:diacylglycerol kinase